jgi:4-carboxymuconolactone decarboxylase
MKIVNMREVREIEDVTPLFTGPILRQTFLPAGTSNDFTMGVVHFPKGVRNKFHTHSSDQILIVTMGNGFVVTDEAEYKVGVGDVILISSGENHWHGAGPDEDFAHITITALSSKTTRNEE